jgi:hypothetical protein
MSAHYSWLQRYDPRGCSGPCVLTVSLESEAKQLHSDILTFTWDVGISSPY